MGEIYKSYPHNPPHYFRANSMYMVTGSILYKDLLMAQDHRKEFFLRTLFDRAELLGWSLEAWAVLGNHYHFIAQAPEDAGTLEKLIRQIHSITAIAINKWDNAPGRKVWYNYWDSCITYEKSYLAGLHYVHTNPVKHRLVNRAEDYPICSYA
jgi:putative transposase